MAMVEASPAQVGDFVRLLSEVVEGTGEVEVSHIVDLPVTESDDSRARGAISDNVTKRNGGHEGSREDEGTKEGVRGEEDEGVEEDEGGERE